MVMLVIDDDDRHGGIVKMVESMMLREIDMKMLRIIEKHCGVGDGAYNGSTPPPKGVQR